MVHEFEEQRGSLVRGALKSAAKERRERPTLATFRGGNEMLLRTLGERLGASLMLSARAAEIHEEPATGYSLRVEGAGGTKTLRCGALVVATEPHVAAPLLSGLSLDFSSLLEEIEYAPVAEVALGYETRQIRGSSDGFGFLVPRGEGLRLLGTVWNSSLFPGRTPEGAALMTSFVGGALDPDAAALASQTLVEIVHTEIARVMKIQGWPVFQSVRHYPRALPQYNLGHTARVEAAEKLCARFPGLWLAGNYLEGPAMGACVKRAARVAGYAQAFWAEQRAAAASRES
jgi:oxygen-dependent protoporphyrinogen oxidase